MAAFFIGIDLTSSPDKPAAGLSIDANLEPASLVFLKEDEEIIAWAENYNPGIIAIDAPLGLPSGLCCLEESCPCQPISSQKGRSCERELAKQGMPCYFTTKRSIIKQMVYRGIRLRKELEGRGHQVIEVYPYASKVRLFGKPVPSKFSPQGLIFLKTHLAALLPPLAPRVAEFNHDLCDAAIAAYTAYLHSRGRTRSLGIPEEGVICLPEFSLA
jgi:predicted nuclease with RNAse H fold